jgi:hypothetical protein
LGIDLFRRPAEPHPTVYFRDKRVETPTIMTEKACAYEYHPYGNMLFSSPENVSEKKDHLGG